MTGNLKEKWRWWQGRFQPRKAIVRLLNGFMAFLLGYRLFHLELNIAVGISCLIISGGWLLLTAYKFPRLTKTYFSISSRIQVLVPLVSCIGLDIIALICLQLSPLVMVAIAELFGWLALRKRFVRVKTEYEKAGAGPIPWYFARDPDPRLLPNGTVILTPGDINNILGEAIGHVEVFGRTKDGTEICASSWMGTGNGFVINHALRIIKGAKKLKNGFSIAIVPNPPLSPEQGTRLVEIFYEMRLENRQWRYKVNARRRAIINRLPLPAKAKKWLVKHTTCSGYDYLALFFGRRRKHTWTCIGACIEAYSRLGIPIMQHRTGALGMGTGFDIINPEDILTDPNFKPFTKSMERKCLRRAKGTLGERLANSGEQLGKSLLAWLARLPLIAHVHRILARLKSLRRRKKTD